MNIILVALSASGMAISLFFLAEDRKIARPSAFARICSPETCKSVLQTPYATIFRLKNYELGLGYYSLTFFYGIASFPQLLHLTALLSLLATAFSVYLAYALIFRLKTACIPCFASQLINAAIFLVLMTAI